MADVTADQVSRRRAEAHGEGGLFGKLTKMVIEGTLEGQTSPDRVMCRAGECDPVRYAQLGGHVP